MIASSKYARGMSGMHVHMYDRMRYRTYEYCMMYTRDPGIPGIHPRIIGMHGSTMYYDRKLTQFKLNCTTPGTAKTPALRSSGLPVCTGIIPSELSVFVVPYVPVPNRSGSFFFFSEKLLIYKRAGTCNFAA